MMNPGAARPSAARGHPSQEVLMHKLRLDPHMLRVESFTPVLGAAPWRGTVAAHRAGTGDVVETDLDILTCAGSCAPDCGEQGVMALTYDGGSTCVYSCPGKCFLTGFNPRASSEAPSHPKDRCESLR
jgi:hypothetical protein